GEVARAAVGALGSAVHGVGQVAEAERVAVHDAQARDAAAVHEAPGALSIGDLEAERIALVPRQVQYAAALLRPAPLVGRVAVSDQSRIAAAGRDVAERGVAVIQRAVLVGGDRNADIAPDLIHAQVADDIRNRK